MSQCGTDLSDAKRGLFIICPVRNCEALFTVVVMILVFWPKKMQSQ